MAASAALWHPHRLVRDARLTIPFSLLVTVTFACSCQNDAGRAGTADASAVVDASQAVDAVDAVGAVDAAVIPDAMEAIPGMPLPAALLDLTNWKLTLPVGDPGSPTEIKQPALKTFSLSPYFQSNAAGTGVIFQAHAGGVTTSNSGYPRSELREMTNAGSENAAWSTTSGTHTMTITQAITHLPVVKAHVVAGQIHDSSDDVVMIRLEGTNLFVEGGGEELGALDPGYQLGTRFTVRITAAAGRIRVYYNDLATPKVDIASSSSGCYFKAGAYTQSNPSRGDDPAAYGEVVIHDLVVLHE
jgi:poly(beta-D-mannuronate) lyase